VAVIDDNQLARVLVITAHPDDVDFGAAGTVASLTARGVAVTYCIVTDGDAGGFDLDVPRASMASLRRDEQARAAKEVGVHELVFLGWPDGRVEPGLDLRRALARVIRQVRPDRVIGPSPRRNLTRIQASHPDHLAVGESTICAVYPDARNAFAFPELLADEGLEPWTVRELWMMADPEPDRVVDITPHVDAKIRALLAHESQLPDPDGMDERVRAFLLGIGEQFGLGEGRSGEAFKVVETG
jgi:LmbE family N-acetylglucosaminyl deacetylase